MVCRRTIDFNTIQTNWGRVPSNQSLVYTFSSTGPDRENQDVGLDGLAMTKQHFFQILPVKRILHETITLTSSNRGPHWALWLLQRNAREFETLSNTNRGSTAQPDVEDINRDNTMNTVDSYQYAIDIQPGMSLIYVTTSKKLPSRPGQSGSSSALDSVPHPAEWVYRCG